MATFDTFTGNGTKVFFDFTFEYLEQSDVKVSLNGTTQPTTAYFFSTDTRIQFNTISAATTLQETTGAPKNGVTVRVFRETDITELKSTFFAGSAIRSQDLNDNFNQNNFAVEEVRDQFVTKTNGQFDTNVDMNSNRITDMADPVNAQDAVTKQYLEDNYFDDGTETITSGESWPDNDTTIATTAAVDNRIDSKIDTAIEGDVLINNTGLTKSATGGQVTLGIGANSVGLDRIKDTDIVASGESNPNNNTTIATTAKIDDMIDAAITGDIAAGDGLSVTNDGDGTITIGIPANSVDLDRLKNDDVITLAEQDAGPTTNDDSIFTSSAAAKRFDTLVQTGTPSGSYQIGKTWLQNDDDQTLKIWNGSTWLDVASGGSFRTQDKVIYVDKTGGDDSKTGHRISGPKLTIKAAINDINADVDTSIKTAGSGYANGTYSNVPLTGGTTGSGLTATITVAGGVVSSVTNVANSTLQEYQIGDILSAADSNLGSGGGSGFELEVTGGGDGMTVIVAAGTYQEIAPIQIKRRNVSIIGMALRSCLVHPTVATQGDHADGNNALFELNSGSFVQNLTLTGMQAGSSGNNTLDSDLPTRQGWNFAFYNNAFITKSPYVQNCTNFSDSQIDNSDLRSHRPRGGSAGDLTNAPTGGGMLVDGNVPKTTSPLRSMVADSYTHVGLNGPGILVTNNGYAQCTSSYAFFNKYHIKALNGGQANLAASTTDFGEKALVADGKSTAAIFSGLASAAASVGDITIDVDTLQAGAGWFGDATKPASNMLVTVTNSDSTTSTYPILSSTAISGGHRVTISRPNASNRSQNDGLEKAVADNAAVSFFLRSMIASSGHTMEYAGSGMDYDALPENGGVPDETKQITELNNGKVWTAITDHNGKFKIGGNQTADPIFEVDQQLGFITIPTGSIAFDLLSDTTPQLGGNVDVNGNDIVSVNNGNINILPNGTGKVTVDGITVDTSTISTVNGSANLILDPGSSIHVKGSIISDTNADIILQASGTGNLDVSGDRIKQVGTPSAGSDAANKDYVDNNFVADAGGTMSGALAMGTNKITGLGTPTANTDAATKAYVDDNSINNVVEDTTPQLGGDLASNGHDIKFADNDKAFFGTGDDLQIYHDSSNSVIKDNGEGKLILDTDGTAIEFQKAGLEVLARFNTDGSVELFHNNVKKLETTADGVDFDGTGSITVPQGTTAQRPTGVNGMFRYNSDDNRFEGYLNNAWGAVGGGATGGGSDGWALEHDNTITTSYTIGTGKNVISAGPLTVNSGAAVTVPSGSTWTIV